MGGTYGKGARTCQINHLSVLYIRGEQLTVGYHLSLHSLRKTV